MLAIINRCWSAESAVRKTLGVCVLGLYFAALGEARPTRGYASSRTINRARASNDAVKWQPEAGVKWQIEINEPVDTNSADADIWDIDLYENTREQIAALHDQNRKVICYFSAGSYEGWRNDTNAFQSADLGEPLKNWEDERWLDVRSPNVREIMKARLDVAQAKGCDGVDPDNVDGYGNTNGLGLTQGDAIDFVNFLASEAHSRGMSIGLKNAGEIVGSVIDNMQWSVNEECAQSSECGLFEPFTKAGKPVFHIEYADGGNSDSDSGSDNDDGDDEDSDVDSESDSQFDRRRVSKDTYSTKATACNSPGSDKFSTVIKNSNLNAWVEYC